MKETERWNIGLLCDVKYLSPKRGTLFRRARQYQRRSRYIEAQ